MHIHTVVSLVHLKAKVILTVTHTMTMIPTDILTNIHTHIHMDIPTVILRKPYEMKICMEFISIY